MEVNSFLEGSRDLQRDNQSLTRSAITAPPSLEKLVKAEDLSVLVLMQPVKLHLPKFRFLHWVKGQSGYHCKKSSIPLQKIRVLVGSSLLGTAHSSCFQEHPYPSQLQGDGPWRCWATQQVRNTSFKGWSTQIWKHHWEMHSCRKWILFIHWCTMPSSFYPLHFLSTNLSTPLLFTWKEWLHSEQEI